MSYSGTVRCGYCYNNGHNRRSCPKLKEYCVDNPDTYTAIKETNRKSYEKTRTCSYCNNSGHNRATCESLQDDFKIFNKINDLYRTEMIEWASKNGVGAGALVELPEIYVSGDGYQHNVLGLIVDIKWETCFASDHDHKTDVCKIALLGALSGKEISLPLPAIKESKYEGPSPWSTSWTTEYNTAKLVSPASASLASAPFAEGVQVSKSALKEIFKGYSRGTSEWDNKFPRPIGNCIQYWNSVAPHVDQPLYDEKTGQPVAE